MLEIKLSTFRGRPGVALGNGVVEVFILSGGGHIARLSVAGGLPNVLWEPTWPLIEPGLREIADTSVYGDHEESKLLSSIAGHNLCCDLFGSQSPGEIAAGMPLHGEAGMVAWTAVQADTGGGSARLVMEADLPHSEMGVRRLFTLDEGSSTVRVEEVLINKVGFQRAIGVAQHATLGSAFLGTPDAPALFTCNADKGMTWPQGDELTSFGSDTEFDYPTIPGKDGNVLDWEIYPRQKSNGDLCTLRISHKDDVGWFTACNPSKRTAVAYAWERAHFPWLVTWEENYSRELPPWNGRELTRGMEFSAFPFPLTREWNVEQGRLLDTPCFTWLDAYEERRYTFSFTVQPCKEGIKEAPRAVVDGNWDIQLYS